MVATMNGSGSFDIKAALTNEIIGGRLDLRMQVSNTVEKVVPFFIRGKNPLDAIARAYIDANVDEEMREILKADALDRKLVFGCNTPPRMYGDLTFVSVIGRFGRECREKFRFRRLYNDRLPKFRVAALAAMRGAIMKGYENKTAEERVAIWDEFCRRAKATPDERKKAEE